MLHRGNFDIVASIKKMPYTEQDGAVVNGNSDEKLPNVFLIQL